MHGDATRWPCAQMGLCYKVAATGDDYVKVWTANSRVNKVVSQWQKQHGLIVTAASADNPGLSPPADKASA